MMVGCVSEEESQPRVESEVMLIQTGRALVAEKKVCGNGGLLMEAGQAVEGMYGRQYKGDDI